jgi:hypothetical protein
MKRVSLVLGLGCLLMISFPSSAQPFPGPDGFGSQFIPNRPESRPGLSLDEAVRRVQRETGGRILSAESVQGAAAVAYRIKVLLPSGRVRVIVVDSGQ